MQFTINTDKGKVRDNNEDYAFAKENILIVADGMGGHNAGEIASREAVETAADILLKRGFEAPFDIIGRSIKEANEKVFSMGTEEKSGMGTTIDICLYQDGVLYIGHVGDSRVYVIRGKEAKRLTQDHSYVEMLLQKGELTKEEAENYPMKNMITRAVGVAQTCEVDFCELKIEKGDKILLCTDGLTNMVSDEEIAYIISREEKIEKAAAKLVKKANEAGGLDNITCLIACDFE